jgi:two-component sensor histidine kinase
MDTASVNVAPLRSATSVAGARDSTRGFLEGLLPALAPETADTVVLVVSELVTNALRHGGSNGDRMLMVGGGVPRVNRGCAPR